MDEKPSEKNLRILALIQVPRGPEVLYYNQVCSLYRTLIRLIWNSAQVFPPHTGEGGGGRAGNVE